MPKATANANVEAETETDVEAKAPVTVSAAIKAAVNAVINADAKVTVAVKAQEKSWVTLAEKLKEETETEEEAGEILKAAFDEHIQKLAGDDEAEKTRLTLKFGTYRSKIKKLAYPVNDKALEKAKEDGLETNDLLAVARGTLQRTKKGEYVKVETGAGGSGGHNKKKPTEALALSLATALTAANTAKLDVDQVATILSESLKDAYELEDLIEALEKLVD